MTINFSFSLGDNFTPSEIIKKLEHLRNYVKNSSRKVSKIKKFTGNQVIPSLFKDEDEDKWLKIEAMLSVGYQERPRSKVLYRSIRPVRFYCFSFAPDCENEIAIGFGMYPHRMEVGEKIVKTNKEGWHWNTEYIDYCENKEDKIKSYLFMIDFLHEAQKIGIEVNAKDLYGYWHIKSLPKLATKLNVPLPMLKSINRLKSA